jgi:endonuclease/exonuclease/phosphatase family metal-dependent hydrolase/predicted NAD-dependent protein-ADP-ribosyltransferase YbiA (DUF1768 family)
MKTNCLGLTVVLLALLRTASATETLTIMSYNIHGGIPNGRSSSGQPVTPRDVQNLSDVVTTSGAAIVGMQEVRCEWLQRRAVALNVQPPDIARIMAGATKMQFCFGSTVDDTAGYPPNPGYLEWGTADQWTNNGARHGEFGNAVLTSLSVVGHAENIPLPTDPGQEQRACLRVELSTQSGSPILVYATHLHHADPAAREKQFRALLQRAAADASTATVFVLGDLNSHPHPGEPDLIGLAAQSGFHDLATEFAKAHGQPPPMTFPADHSDRRIDYILCSRALPVLDVRTIDTTASDHLPLVTTVQLPDAPTTAPTAPIARDPRYPAHWFTPVPKEGAPDWEVLPQEAGPGEVILSKRNELGLLSNFTPTTFTLDGRTYASVEGFWQMMLFPEGADDPRASAPGLQWKHTRDQVALMTAFTAKSAGDAAWDNMKKMGIDWVTYQGRRMPYYEVGKGEHYQLIVRAMRAKLEQNPEVKRVLLATGDLKLRPDHHQPADAPPSWRYFDIWMQLRDELNKSAD